MSERKPLFMNQTEGFSEEMATTDSITLGGLTMGGAIDMQDTYKIVNAAAATEDGDVLVYGQSGANLSGLDIDTSALTMNSQKITGLGAPTEDADASTKKYVDDAVTTGRIMKEFLLHNDQLSNSIGMLPASALFMSFVAKDDDRVVLTDGATSRIYYFGTGTGDVQVTKGASAVESMTNLAAAITADSSGVWSATFSTDLEAINTDGVVVIYDEAVTGTDKIYTTNWTTDEEAQIVDFGGLLDYTSKAAEDIPASLPGSTNFGVKRAKASLTPGETHYIEVNDTFYSWDEDGDVWQTTSGPGSIPDATSASGGGIKGKVTFDSDYGLSVASGVAKIDLAADKALEFSSGDLAVKVEASKGLAMTSAGLKGVADATKAMVVGANGFGAVVEADGAIVFDGVNGGLEIKLEASNPSLQIASNELGAKLDAARAITKGASGIGVNLEDTNPALAIADNQLDVKYQTAKALGSDASGLYVKVETDGAIVYDAVNGGLEAKLEASNPSLQIASNELGVKLDGARAITKGASGIGVNLEDTNPALAIADNQLDVKYQIAKGLGSDASGLYVKVETDGAIIFDAVNGGLETKLEASNPTLKIASNELGVKLDAAGAIVTGASGIKMNLEDTNPAVAITDNQLDVKYQTAKGLTSDASGLYVKVDGSTVTYDGSGNLQASISPEAQKIENTYTVKADDLLAAGDPCYFDVNDKVAEADAGTDSKARIIGVTRSTTGTSPAKTAEVVSIGPCAAILTGATVNTPYYLADGGGYTTTLPGAGKRIIQIGFALNATDLWVDLKDFGKVA